MPDKAVVFHPAAAEELHAAFQWYHQHNPHAALAFWHEMEEGIGELSDVPAHCPAYLNATQRYLLKRFPYFIVFREVRDVIEIVAVAHGRRKPGYWRSRAS